MAMRELGIASAILWLAVGILLAVWLDACFAVSWQPGFYLYAALPLLVALLARRERTVQWMILVYLAVMIALPFLDMSPVKPFTRFYSGLRTGMGEEAVLAELARQFPDNGRFPRPVEHRSADGSLSFQLDPNDGAYNAEIVLVRMDGGQVVSKQYLPD